MGNVKVVGKQPARHAGKSCPDGESDNFVFRGVNPHRFSGDFIFPDRYAGSPMAGVDKIFDIGWQDLRILSFFSIFFLELMIWVGVPLGKGRLIFSVIDV